MTSEVNGLNAEMNESFNNLQITQHFQWNDSEIRPSNWTNVRRTLGSKTSEKLKEFDTNK